MMAPPWPQAMAERMEGVAWLARATPAITIDEQISLGNEAKKLTLGARSHSGSCK